MASLEAEPLPLALPTLLMLAEVVPLPLVLPVSLALALRAVPLRVTLPVEDTELSLLPLAEPEVLLLLLTLTVLLGRGVPEELLLPPPALLGDEEAELLKATDAEELKLLQRLPELLLLCRLLLLLQGELLPERPLLLLPVLLTEGAAAEPLPVADTVTEGET